METSNAQAEVTPAQRLYALYQAYWHINMALLTLFGGIILKLVCQTSHPLASAAAALIALAGGALLSCLAAYKLGVGSAWTAQGTLIICIVTLVLFSSVLWLALLQALAINTIRHRFGVHGSLNTGVRKRAVLQRMEELQKS